MKILVDTSVWSVVLRRKNPNQKTIENFRSLIDNNELVTTGIIVQEVLSYISEKSVFEQIQSIITKINYIEPSIDDYVFAAELSTKSKNHGISSKTIDLLLASIAIRRNIPLLTEDNDFDHISKIHKMKLMRIEKLSSRGPR